MDHDNSPQDATVRPAPIAVRAVVPSVTAWQNYQHAPDWFADASAEAGRRGHDARRREILFAVCLAESYLTEWVLMEALADDRNRFETFFRYFPEGDNRGLVKIWKQTTDQLFEEKLLVSRPTLGGPQGESWRRLIDYRNGLVHASSSRPSTSSPRYGDLPKPLPSKDDLDNCEPGWALRIAVERIVLLHDAAGTPPPEWLSL